MTSTGSDDDDGEPIMVSVGAALCVSGVYALVLTRRQAGLLQQQSTGQPPPAAPCPPADTRRHRRQCADGRAVVPNPVAPCDEWPGGGENQLDSATHTPWVEFAINNSWHETVRNSPFFLNYGQHPLTPAVMDLPRKVPKAAEFVEGIEKAVRKAKHCWRVAQQRMKALVDGKRREVSYHPGAQVLLSTVNMRNNQNEQGVRKLKPRYVGPFTVLRMIGKWLEGEPVYEVEKLLAHRVVKLKGRNRGKGRPKSKEAKKGLEFLVRWAGYSEEHDTWEPQKNLLNCEEAMQAYIEQHGALPEL